MADSFRKRARGVVTDACSSSSTHPKWGWGGRAKLLMLLLLLLPGALWTGCRKSPEDNTPPDVIKQVVMKKWSIEPERIEVPEGAEVELVVTSTDVEHGIAIPKLGIREPVQPGRPTIVRFRAKSSGTYAVSCSVLCGKGHKDMTGVIVVTPAHE
jgi:cytochrome c oxidase subunit II